ncbi:hypothetical protein [Bosea sp. 2RAB26]|uniref:hypothetical protein n=1 Tax=Bosea sp. 2RAB26 TaxID=3237476 RepID=UPI003F8FB4DC
MNQDCGRRFPAYAMALFNRNAFLSRRFARRAQPCLAAFLLGMWCGREVFRNGTARGREDSPMGTRNEDHTMPDMPRLVENPSLFQRLGLEPEPARAGVNMAQLLAILEDMCRIQKQHGIRLMLLERQLRTLRQRA